jgi:DNA-binding CsgD family transcriptional regulator
MHRAAPLPFAEKAAELAERLKELNCLYGIARLFSQRELTLEQLLRRVVQIVPSAWQFPELACCRVCLRGQEFRSKNFRSSPRSIRRELTVRKKRAGYMEIAYATPGARLPAPPFLKEERELMKAVTELLGSIIEKKEAEVDLKKTARQLQEQKMELERKNIALREVISQIEIEKQEIQGRMTASIERLVLPTLARLKDPKLPEQVRGRYLSMIEQNLEQIASNFAQRVSSSRTRLSPREVEVCNLIRGGFSNKQIAEALGLSTLTVERHRHNIRRKLDIAGQKVNLATFLHQL